MISSNTPLEVLAGSLLVGGFHGTELPPRTAQSIEKGRLGGVILFRRNVASVAQVRQLNQAVLTASGRSLRDGPLPFVAVDEEGGPVARLRGLLTDLPAMATLGSAGDLTLCTELGEMLGTELRALEFNLNFAPVLDVNTNPDNPIIGVRSFSTDAKTAALAAIAFAQGLRRAGVVACGKHFPGHGDTALDSHVNLPVIKHTVERLRAVEWLPYRHFVSARLPMVMTAHIVLERIDDDRPATFSSLALRTHLRQELGFQGVIVSDDLEMAAVADRYAIPEMMRLGLEAGVDLFLICHSHEKQELALEALVSFGTESPTARRWIVAAARRVETVRRTIPRDATDVRVVGCDAHRALLDRLGTGAEGL